jgi:glycosyltransferase involved in cell wall biosynthesis
MWNGKTVSVVLMTYAERDAIQEVIDGFLETGLVDEVLVVDNNAERGTREEVAKTSGDVRAVVPWRELRRRSTTAAVR